MYLPIRRSAACGCAGCCSAVGAAAAGGAGAGAGATAGAGGGMWGTGINRIVASTAYGSGGGGGGAAAGGGVPTTGSGAQEGTTGLFGSGGFSGFRPESVISSASLSEKIPRQATLRTIV